MNTYVFHNVEIALEADTAKEAYAKLCELLSKDESVEYTTDTFTGPKADHATTSHLWPTEE